MTTYNTLYRMKLVCRWALGLVWIWEGLVPKILWQTEMQRQLVLNSGLYWPDPDTFMALLGFAMILAGMIICVGWMERLSVLVASVTMTILIFLVVGNRLESISDLHGGIAKDVCLYACAWVVWKLSHLLKNENYQFSEDSPGNIA